MSEKDGDADKEKSTSAPSGIVVSDQEQSLAQSALADFTKGNYTSCVTNLSKLETTWTHDHKVLHNKFVADYYKSELKKTDQFRKNLSSICALPHANSDEIVGLDDVEQCAMYYNHAVVLFHLKQYNLALKIMEKVFTFIEPMEESLAHKVCLLLIELHLCMRQVHSAVDHVTYITKQFASTKNIQVLEKEPAEEKPIAFDAATDALRVKLRQFEIRCYLMLDLVKESKRELKTLSSGGFSLPSTFLKANLEYLKSNYTKSIKVLQSINGSKLPTFKETGESINLLYLNNMGCIHHYMGKHNLAWHYFHQALQDNEENVKSEPGDPLSNKPLYTLGSNKKYELMYNLGVSLLYAQKPAKACDCLTAAAQVFHMNPRLWLRLSECCIMAHKMGNEEDFNLRLRKNDLVQSAFGTGLYRKLILTSRLSTEYRNNSEQSSSMPGSSLEFASLCLKNALYLLPPEEEGERIEGWTTPPFDIKAEKRPVKTSGIHAAPSVPIDNVEVNNLRCSVLAASAYVNLCLGEYITACEHARLLIMQPTLSGAHKMLGHLYLAESLILMDRISEAVEHLNPELVSDVAIIPTGQVKTDHGEELRQPLKEWFPKDLNSGKLLMQYHLAVAFSMRGEYDKASECLKIVWLNREKVDIPIHVVMLVVYIELQLGHADNARQVIKTQLPQYRY